MYPKAERYEAIVIGAGVMGSATAYYLAKKYGSKAVLLEQYDFLHKRGSSHGESRIIRLTYPEVYYTRLMPEAYRFWGEVEDEARTKLLTKTGGLDFGKKTDVGLQSVIQSAKKNGIEHEVLTPEEVKTRFPTINLPKDYVAIYSPESGVLNATKCVATLQNLAHRYGCTLVDNAPVISISKVSQSDGTELIKVISSSGQEFIGKKCIVTTGPWTKRLVESFENINLQLQPIQTTAAYWKVRNPEAYSAKKFPVFIHYNEGEIYSSPALEIPNMFKCCAHFGTPCDPDTRDFQPDLKTLENVVVPFLNEMFTEVDTSAPGHTVSCTYTKSPDNNFIIDQLPSSPNIFVGCGFSGHGFKLGTVVGKILSELVISGVHPYPDVHKHFSLARF